MALREYKRKRDFSKSGEPQGKTIKRKNRQPIFVIQKHAASRLHYDFRLEYKGVLKSWAVPKGVPTEKGEKRLAMQVEDHPMEYVGFEGVIPKGNYGAGTVMVWDTGTYEFGEGKDDFNKGSVHLTLHGKKLNGDWTLVRMRENQWLLIKSGSSMRTLSKKKEDESAVSARSMKQISLDQDAEWISNRGKQSRKPGEHVKEERKGLSVLKDLKPAFIDPMKPKLMDDPPKTEEWIYELKFDGVRAIAIKNGVKVELVSRNKKALNEKYPDIPPVLKNLDVKQCVIDGEVVALDSSGRSSFQLLQAYEMNEEHPPLCYYVFDLLNLEGKDLRNLPLHRRKALLEDLVKNLGDPVRFSGNLGANVDALLKQVKRHGLEGLIGKQADSRYETGRRSGSWIKLKCTNEQEFVIGGYSPPRGSRKYFGAILIGYYKGKDLMYAGKVGTGFDTKLLAMLHRKFQRFKTDDCPFVNLPTKTAGKWGQGITPSQMKLHTWLRPQLVAQIRFSEWTRDGRLRQPVFLGLREDKQAKKVVREKAA